MPKENHKTCKWENTYTSQDICEYVEDAILHGYNISDKLLEKYIDIRREEYAGEWETYIDDDYDLHLHYYTIRRHKQVRG